MNICGVLVHVVPPKRQHVRAALQDMAGVEIHQEAGDSRLIVTVEDTPASTAFDTITAIHRLDGIVAASLVYHHFDPADAETEVPSSGDVAHDRS
jgi:nitrate reductase NapD